MRKVACRYLFRLDTNGLQGSEVHSGHFNAFHEGAAVNL